MSFTALNWAWEQQCPSGTAKAVLVYLANCASQRAGDCWPSIETICARTQHHPPAVRRAIRELVDSGLLCIDERYNSTGRRLSNVYRLPVVSIAEHNPRTRESTLSDSQGSESPDDLWTFSSTLSKSQGSDPIEIDPTPAKSHPLDPIDFDTGTPAISIPNTKQDTLKEDRPVPLRDTPRSQIPRTHLPAKQNSASVILNAWNAMAEREGLPTARAMTKGRQDNLRARLREHGIDGLLTAIDKIAASAFCHGTNDRGWKADLDFLLQAKSCARAIEGFYDNRDRQLDPNRLGGWAGASYRAHRELAQARAEEATEQARIEGSIAA